MHYLKMISNQACCGDPKCSSNVLWIKHILMLQPINEITLNSLPQFEGLQTNTKLLSSGIIWFWTRTNIPWLDFFIDSAGAVKVSQSPGSHTLTFSGNLAQTAVSFHLRRTNFRNWCLCVFLLFLFHLKKRNQHLFRTVTHVYRLYTSLCMWKEISNIKELRQVLCDC